MNIAVIANTSWNLFNFRRNLIRRLQQDGHTVHLVAPYDAHSEKIRPLAASYHSLYMIPKSTNPLHEFRTLIHLYIILHRLHPDAVLTFTPKVNLYTGLCRYALRFLYLPNISGLGQSFQAKGFLRRVVKGLYALTLKRADVVFFQNAQDRETLSVSQSPDGPHCEVLPGSGVDTETFRPPPNAVFQHPRRVLMVGRLIPEKGFEMFLEVAERLCTRDDRAAEFWVMAIPENTPASRRLEEKLRRCHQAGFIRNLPPCDHVADMMCQADIVALPSVYHEGTPRTLLEAMACGKPIITTDWKGCRETIPNGDNGLLISPDSQSLYEAVARLADASDAELEKMGRCGRHLAETVFAERLVIDAYCRRIAALTQNQ